MPVAELRLRDPSTLPGLLRWGASRTHSPGPGHPRSPLKEACPDLSHECWNGSCQRAGQTLGLMSVSLTGARPGNQHAGLTSQLVCLSAYPLNWMLPKEEARPGLHLLPETGIYRT